MLTICFVRAHHAGSVYLHHGSLYLLPSLSFIGCNQERSANKPAQPKELRSVFLTSANALQAQMAG